MRANGPGEMTSKAGGGSPDGFLGLLRAVALSAVLAGTGGSVGLMLRAGRSAPRLLLVLFTLWVLSPFVVLAWANMVSKRWSVITRATLYCLTLVLTLGSLGIYLDRVLRPPRSTPAFVFVIVPPVSWLLMTIVLAIAALISRRRSHRAGVAELNNTIKDTH